MPSWQPGLYLQFADERARPALDLIQRVELEEPRCIVDLGCGPGNSTALLRQRWPLSDITGLDSSPAMIEVAMHDQPHGRWLLADIADWRAERPVDLLFSNASLHWLPDHAALLPRLFDQVAEGGALAVQMPATYIDSPLRQVVYDVAADPAWRGRLTAARQAISREAPPFYYDVLQPLASRLELWETEYFHVLTDARALVDWFRGSGLRPYLDALGSDAERAEFEARVQAGYAQAYPPQGDGKVLFPFRRVFFVAYR